MRHGRTLTVSSQVDGALHTIGWKEFVGLPALGIGRLKAKVDTGARTSTLHVSGVETIEERADGSAVIEIHIPLDRRGARRVTSLALMVRSSKVTDSGGHTEIRPVIETDLEIGPIRKRIYLTLSDRRGMRFRMLLGRKALEGDFLVDVGRKYLMGERGRKARPDVVA